jgi:hypothetical protein
MLPKEWKVQKNRNERKLTTMRMEGRKEERKRQIIGSTFI